MKSVVLLSQVVVAANPHLPGCMNLVRPMRRRDLALVVAKAPWSVSIGYHSGKICVHASH